MPIRKTVLSVKNRHRRRKEAKKNGLLVSTCFAQKNIFHKQRKVEKYTWVSWSPSEVSQPSPQNYMTKVHVRKTLLTITEKCFTLRAQSANFRRQLRI